jgi:hypothetical protein
VANLRLDVLLTLSQNARHIGAATSTSAEWLTAFLVQEVTPIAVTKIGWRYYIVFTCVCLASIPIVYFFYPETSGKTLEEIDMIFASGRLHHRGSASSLDEQVVTDKTDKEPKRISLVWTRLKCSEGKRPTADG